MRNFAKTLAISVVMVAASWVFLVGHAVALDWMTTASGSKTCGRGSSGNRISSGQSCYNTTADGDTAVLLASDCLAWTLVIYSTSVTAMPKFCMDSACSLSRDILTSVLSDTGEGFVASPAPLKRIKVTTTGSPTLEFICRK